MSEFKSEKTVINAPCEKIFSFLGDFNNFERLLPEEVISWKSTADTCSFTVKGMADLEMSIAGKRECSLIQYASGGKSPFPFRMDTLLNAIDESITEVQIVLDANLNPMLNMMVSRPLKNFVNFLAVNLKKEMEKGWMPPN